MAGGRVPVLVGPTAVGKTAVALALAAHWPLEVISADSRQIYRRLDIGTAKPTRRERARVPHHGLDLVEPGTRYSAGHFARDAAGWIAERAEPGQAPGRRGRHGTLRPGARRRALPRAGAGPGPAPRRSTRSTARLEPLELLRWAGRLDPGFRGGGRQRAARAIEVALLTGHPLSHWQEAARAARSHPTLVHCAHRAPAGAAPADRAPGGGDGAPRADRGGGGGAGGGPRAAAPGLDGIGIREAVEYLHGGRPRGSVAEAIAHQHAAVRQAAGDVVPTSAAAGEVLTLDATRPPEKLAAEIASYGRHW